MSLELLAGASWRRFINIALFVAAVVLSPGSARAQDRGNASVRSRSLALSRDSLRNRREELLLRFDSLRFEFEHQRLSTAQRAALASRMHETVMALQESLDDMTVRAGAMDPPRAMAAAQVEARTMPSIAIEMQTMDPTRGYLGLSFDGPSVDERRGNERIIRFLDYPRIALVEPSSPAERAGIVEGDTLVQLNGSDVRDRAISLTRMLVPDHHIRVRVRRDGNPMDFRVTVAEAPGYVMRRMAPMPPMAREAPTAVRVYPGEPFPRMAPMPSTPMPPAMAWDQDGLVGARLENINEGLGRALGTNGRGGVLVLRVVPGTPADQSGLRDGDVILRASGDAVRSVRALREALQDADGDEGVKLVVLRERRQRDVTLRW